MKTRRIVSGFLAAVLLGSGFGLAQGEVVLPPAEVEVAILEDAFAQVTDFFRFFIADSKSSFIVLGARVSALEESEFVLRLGLEELGGRVAAIILEVRAAFQALGERIQGLEESGATLKTGLSELGAKFTKFEAAVVPAIMSLEARATALEHEILSFSGRIGALDHAYEGLTVRIDNNRTKIEALEVALATFSAQSGSWMSAMDEAQLRIAAQEEEIASLRTEVVRLAQGQQAQWSAIFLVPIAVGGLLFLLLSQGG